MTAAAPDTSEAVADRILQSALGMVDTLAVYLGDRLGWYRSLAAGGPATALQLAERTGTHPRYTREWLEQQAVTGLLSVAEPGRPPGAEAGEPGSPDRADARVYSISAGAAEVLTDEGSLNYVAPLARMFAATGPALPALLRAYRSGGGVSWDELGDDARQSQADMNRPWFEHELAGALEDVPSVHEALSQPRARIADVGCGAGWSSIALAKAYPEAEVHGYDIDEPSIGMARDNAKKAGVQDRVRFTAADAAGLPARHYTAAFAFECIHDMPRPVDVLAAVRRSLVPGGFMVVMDEAVADEFAPNGDELERLMYGFSLFICLPDGMSSPPSVGTGTVMRPATLRRYAEEAGFAQTEDLPISEFGLWRFYRLTGAPAA
jgi:SAM-dependent methyltransferase